MMPTPSRSEHPLMTSPGVKLHFLGKACDRFLHQARTGTAVVILKRSVAAITAASREVEDALSDVPDGAIVKAGLSLDDEHAWLIDHPEVDITKATVPDDLSSMEPRPLDDLETLELDLQVIRDIAAQHDLTITVTDDQGRSLL